VQFGRNKLAFRSRPGYENLHRESLEVKRTSCQSSLQLLDSDFFWRSYARVDVSLIIGILAWLLPTPMDLLAYIKKSNSWYRAGTDSQRHSRTRVHTPVLDIVTYPSFWYSLSTVRISTWEVLRVFYSCSMV
jgi:hypothetical protein